jgi:hypothetical protein
MIIFNQGFAKHLAAGGLVLEISKIRGGGNDKKVTQLLSLYK